MKLTYGRSLMLLIAISLFSSSAAPGGCNIVAALAPARASYLGGEPVELVMTLTNAGNGPARFSGRYPFFDGFNHAGIRIYSKADRAAGAEAEAARDLAGSRAPVLTLAPGESWSTRIYLQRFDSEVQQGTHHVAYSIDIPCLNADLQADGAVVGKGELQVVIQAGRQEDLSRAIAEYAKGLEASDYWPQRTAVEALSVTNSPEAIPYLRRIADIGFSDLAFGAIAKFRGNAKAELLLRDIAQTSKPRPATGALLVLRGWKYSLSASDLGQVLSRDDAELKLAAMQYAEEVPSRAYIPAISSYTSDPNPRVAGEAKRVLQVLSTVTK